MGEEGRVELLGDAEEQCRFRLVALVTGWRIAASGSADQVAGKDTSKSFSTRYQCQCSSAFGELRNHGEIQVDVGQGNELILLSMAIWIGIKIGKILTF